MLNWMHYNQTVDIWSVGCIMAELLTSRTLFPGQDRILFTKNGFSVVFYFLSIEFCMNFLNYYPLDNSI